MVARVLNTPVNIASCVYWDSMEVQGIIFMKQDMPRLNETRCTIWYHLYNLYKTSMVFFTNIQVFKSLFDKSSFLCLIFQVRNKFFVLVEIISQYLEIVIVRGVFRTLSNMIELFNNIVKSVPIRSFFWSAFSRIRTEYGEI